MAVVTTVNASSLEFGNRIDAELYRPSLRKSFQNLERSGYALMKIRNLCNIRSGTTPIDRIDGLKKGPILFKTTDVRNKVISPKEDYYRISDEIHERMLKTKILDRDVLLNIVGATLDVIGRSAFISKLEDEANITQAMVLLRCKTPELLPGFLFAYLNTNYGQDQIARYARPTGQYNLNLYEVGQICIPIIPEHEQQDIEHLVLASAVAQETTTICYIQAKQFLETELGLDKLSFPKPIGYTVRLSELELSRRFDSERFYPAFSNWVSNLQRNIKLVPLASLLTCCQRGKQPIYTKQGLPVINSKHVQPNKIVLEGNRSAQASPLVDYQIRHGDTLINGTGRGTIGRAAPYLIADQQAIPDNHVTILRTSSLDPAYLSYFLNSQAGQLQVERHQRGSSGQLELYPFDIRKCLVWDAPGSVQLEIRRLHDQATESAQRSRQLLEQAKSRVEQLIEEAAKP